MSCDWLDILATPLPVSDAIAFVADAGAGGINVFLGTTRAESHPQTHHPLVALDYEAYQEMALPQLRTLAVAARSQWPILKLVILHRTGRVALAEPSVLIAASTPHRQEAFDSVRFIINTLKADVAIWKKEVWSDGSSTWVHPAASP